jgi:hypothetical protein
VNELSLLLMLLVLGPERASASVRVTTPSALPAAVAAAPVAPTTIIQPLRGRVDTVDLANRRVTLTDSGGTTHSLKVSAAVYNLADIIAGDRVIVQGTKTLALSIHRQK